MMGGFPGRGMVPPFPSMMAPGMMGINPGIMPGMMGMNGMPMTMMQQSKGNSWNLDSGDGKSGMAIDANVRVLARKARARARGGGYDDWIVDVVGVVRGRGARASVCAMPPTRREICRPCGAMNDPCCKGTALSSTSNVR